MGGGRPSRKLGVLIAVAAVILLGLAPGAAAQADVGVAVKDELVETIPVTTKKKAEPMVVMRLDPGQIPALAADDVIKPAAELEVTTQCDVGQGGRRCAYDPKVRVWLALSGRKGDTSAGGPESMALGERKKRSCSKSEHHCLIVFKFDQAATQLGDGAPPCVATDSCHINLVAKATHGKAHDGDKLIIGANEDEHFLKNGDVERGSKGRLMVLRERGGVKPHPDPPESSKKNVSVPTNANATQVISVDLGKLEGGTRYAIEATVRAKATGRARFSTRMFLTKNKGKVEGNGIKGTTPRDISEHNGINCIGKCRVRRVAVFVASRDSRKRVFLKLFAKSAVPGPGTANVKATAYHVRVMRYGPAAARPPEKPGRPSPDPGRPAGLAGVGQNEPYAITCNKVRLDGWVDPQGSATTWFFEYWQHGVNVPLRTGSGNAKAGDGRVAASRLAEHLQPQTGYSAVLIADNAAGRSISNIVSFRTSKNC